MPLYRITAPNGQTYQIEGPPGASDADVANAVMAQYPEAGQAPKQSTIGSELVRGGKQMLSSARTGLESILSPEEAAKAGVARGEAISKEAGEGVSFDQVKKAYEDKGLLSAAGEAVSQIPRALAGQGANLASMAGGARLGAMAGSTFGPAGTLVGGALGAGATLLPQFMGSNVERQASEQMEKGEPVKIDRTKAYSAAAAQAALEGAGTAFTLGKRVVKGVLGVAEDTALATAKSQAELVKAAERSLAGTLTRGAARGTTEMPVEVAQQVLERAQAGLDLTSPDAIKEYGESAYQALLIGGPLGAAGNVMERGGARNKLAEQQLTAQREEQARLAARGPQIAPETPEGTQGALFSEAEMGERVPAPKEEPVTQPAPTAPQGEQLDLGLDFQREYADMVKEREALKQQPQTPEVKARIKDLNDQLLSLHENEVESIRAEKAQEEQARAKFPGLAETAPIIPRTQMDLFGEEQAPSPAAQQATEEIPEPTKREPKGGYQYKLPLRTVPEGKEPKRDLTIPARPNEITMQDLEDIGVPLRTSKKWLEENVVGKTPAEIQVLVANDPNLILRKGSRAEILKYLTAPVPEGFKETPRVTPTTKTNKPESRVKPRGGKPSVGVSGQPARTNVVQPGAGVPPTTGAPATPVGLGLAPAGQPAGKGAKPATAAKPTLNAPVTPTTAPSTTAPAAPTAEPAVAAKPTPKAAPAEKPETPSAAKPAEAVKSRYERLLDISNDESIPAATRRQAEKQMDLLDDPTMNKSKEDRKGNEDYADRFLARVEGLKSVATAEGQSLDSLQEEVKNAKGILGSALRRMVASGKVVLEAAHPSGKKIGGFYDGEKVTLYANGIPSGQSMAVALHEVGAHLGMERLLGKKQYNAVIDRILDMVAKGDGSTESKMAQAAYKRIPVSDFKRGAGRDEMVAYFIEEMALSEAAGTLPKVGPLRNLWNQISTAIITSINKALGTSFRVKDFSAQDILDIAKSALVAESKTETAENTGKQRFSVNPTLLEQSKSLIPTTPNLLQSIQNSAAKTAAKNAGVSLATRIRTSFVDPLATVEQRITKNYDQSLTDELGNTTATIVARQAQDVTKLLPAFFEDGILRVDPKTRMLEVASGSHAPNDIFPAIKGLAKTLGLKFEEAYAYASTVLEGMRLADLVKSNHAGDTDALIHWRTPDGAIDTAKIDAAVAAYNADPQYKQLSDIMDAPRIELINELEKSGRLTPEMAQEWREVTNYVPFDRESDGDAFASLFSSNKKTSAKGLSRLGRLPQLVGSEWRPVSNVFENYFKTTAWLAGQLAKQNANSYMMGAMVNAGYAAKIPTPKLSRTGNVVTVYAKGEETHYDVASKWDQMAFLDDTGPMPNWVKFMGQVSGVLRTAVTANPVFAATQVAQDVQGALLFSGVKHPLSFVMASIGNFGSLAWHETVNAYKAARGQATTTHKIEQDMRHYGLSGEVDYTASNPAVEELFRQGVRHRTKLGSTTLGAIIHGLEQITHASDLAVRKALFDDEMQHSKDLLKASTKARELINFRRRGGNQWVQHWTTMVPFFNAALQSTDIVYRAVTSKADPSGLEKQAARKQFKKNVMLYGGAVLVYSVMRGGDDDYDEMDRRIRDNNWVFPNNVRIPIRGDMGVFKVAIENGMDYFRRHGTTEELEAAEAIKTALWYAYEQYGGRNLRAPAAIQPLLENFANFSFMTGRAQVGTYQQSKPKHLQETAGTSETAKAVADFVYSQFNGMEISPVHIDNVLRGYLGTTAASLTVMTDAAMYPDKVDRPLHKMAAIGAFAWDESQLTNPKNEFYALQEKVLPPVRALNEMMQTDPARAMEYANEHQAELALASTVNASLQELSKLRQYEKYLRGPESAKSMTSEEREEQLTKVQGYANQMVKYVRQLRHEMKI